MAIIILPNAKYVRSANCSHLGHSANPLHLRKWSQDHRTHGGARYSVNISQCFAAANHIVANRA